MQSRTSRLVPILILALLVGFFLARQFGVGNNKPHVNSPVPVPAEVKPVSPGDPPPAPPPSASIPQKVYDVLKYIRENNHAMPGYVGGRIFSNREELLPREDNNGKPILYHEWDVNPKVAGQNRGTERIITGSDGRAWYTNNHYQSFQQIK